MQPYGYGQPMMPPGARGYDGNIVSCPKCASQSISKPSFTWWGGMIGPLILNHRVCGSCGFGFNGKSGNSNQTAIAIYLGFGILLAFGLIALRSF